MLIISTLSVFADGHVMCVISFMFEWKHKRKTQLRVPQNKQLHSQNTFVNTAQTVISINQKIYLQFQVPQRQV